MGSEREGAPASPDLRNAGGGEGRVGEVAEDVVDAAAELLLQRAADVRHGLEGDRVLQLLQLRDVGLRHNVAARGHVLAHLDPEAAQAAHHVVHLPRVGGVDLVPARLVLLRRQRVRARAPLRQLDADKDADGRVVHADLAHEQRPPEEPLEDEEDGGREEQLRPVLEEHVGRVRDAPRRGLAGGGGDERGEVAEERGRAQRRAHAERGGELRVGGDNGLGRMV